MKPVAGSVPSASDPSASDPPAPDSVVDGDDPRALVWDIIRGEWRFSALYAFVALDLARWLRDGPLDVAELARRCGADAGALARLLRTNAALGVVRTVSVREGRRCYALTPAGLTLHGGAEHSMRSVVIPQGAPDFREAMGSLAEAVRAGRSPFVTRFGSLYAYLEGDPEARGHFDAHMATRSRTIADAAVARYDFSGVSCLVDVGGGVGTILAAVLKANPRVRGVLFELEHVLPGAREFLASEGVLDRCELVAGDFFRSVPRADAYLLSNVLHNWSDTDAIAIGRTVVSAMSGAGRCLFLDMLLPEDDRPHLGKDLDMRMLALHPGGRERGRAEYLALLREAGLVAERVVDLPYALSLIEAVPAR
ncbi:hydroxyneurosporene methyltransferase [Streptomyces roseirectus]|uniref:Hydroxyneurosporene methyltransferase n=1 Tax=Streptomyces roseirectus TaxID=2768066 RepID=A0A7H0IQP2_9ACTN|nr:methyltransferase [Streptomyces roseirectus]QNP75108.1 hydroxyneurosporene methyltransferase [Streptomyces roseirectus]